MGEFSPFLIKTVVSSGISDEGLMVGGGSRVEVDLSNFKKNVFNYRMCVQLENQDSALEI